MVCCQPLHECLRYDSRATLLLGGLLLRSVSFPRIVSHGREPHQRIRESGWPWWQSGHTLLCRRARVALHHEKLRLSSGRDVTDGIGDSAEGRYGGLGALLPLVRKHSDVERSVVRGAGFEGARGGHRRGHLPWSPLCGSQPLHLCVDAGGRATEDHRRQPHDVAEGGDRCGCLLRAHCVADLLALQPQLCVLATASSDDNHDLRGVDLLVRLFCVSDGDIKV
mmetsp:Transcript_27657/g.72924  ORF Transcript_27657/g.72924 Transcript_27657/m.72924 type:complete len:223 (-) Transcript_27657:1000-1668(-)